MKNRSLSWVTLGTASVCGLIVVFAMLAAYSASNIAGQSERMYQHPYRVKSEAQAMRTRLLEMKLHLLPVLLTAASESPDSAYRMLMERDRMQDASVAVIREYYLGPRGDIPDLETALALMRAARSQAVRDCAALGDLKDAMAYAEQWVNPHSDAVDAVLQRITASADNRVEEFRQAAESARDIMIAGTVLLCVLLIALVIGINRNERRKNRAIAYREQLFNLLSNSTDDVFFIYDSTNARLEYVSENSLRLLGLTPAEFYADAGAIRCGLTPEAAGEFMALLTDGALCETVERDLKYRRDNQVLDLKLRLYPVRSGAGLQRLIVVLSDQTRAIAQQIALHDALTSARKAGEAKQEFLSRMSHEIRTPMNAIIGMTAIAEKYLGEKERVADCLGKIAVSSKYLLRLINDVLDIAKIERGKFSFSYGPFDFRNFINRLTAIAYPQTEAHQQKFEITISGLDEETLIGDELRLNQILINLLSNAIKFTPAGGEIRLEITRLETESAKALLRFVVRDTGIGMSGEFLDRLFTPFEQGEAIAHNYGGTGLGLAIAKNLASLMHGSITVQSEEGKGTAFILELPFDLPEQKVRSPRADLYDLNVLVVDDDPGTCEYAMALLEKIGVRGDWACSGPEAVEKAVRAHAAGRDYDVCFIDWRMPGMDGMETTRRLRAEMGSDALIIIISAYDWTAIEQEARSAGVSAFIAKPLFASSFYNALVAIHHPGHSDRDSAQENGQYDFSGKKILLVEDNLINQEIALDILQSAGASVDCANDGQESLDMYLRSREGEYALILMDVQMPRMDGYQATRAIRSSSHPNAKSVPILAMTASAFSSDILAAEEAGMNGHLAKPIDAHVFCRTIAEHLSS